MTPVLTAALKRAIRRNFLLSIRVNFSNYVLVSRLVQLIGRVISHGGQCLQHRAFGRGGFRGRRLCRGRFGMRLRLDVSLGGGGGYGWRKGLVRRDRASQCLCFWGTTAFSRFGIICIRADVSHETYTLFLVFFRRAYPRQRGLRRTDHSIHPANDCVLRRVGWIESMSTAAVELQLLVMDFGQ